MPDSTSSNPWILNPGIDLLFCCGGLFWIIFCIVVCAGLNPLLVNQPAAYSALLLLTIGHHLFGDPHQPATLYRVYFSEAGRPVAKTVACITAAAFGAALCTYFVPASSVFFIKVVLAWGLQHQLAQSYGIALLYCSKRKVVLSRTEKTIVATLVNATVLYLILRMFAVESYGHIVTATGMEIQASCVVPQVFVIFSMCCLQGTVLLFTAMVLRKFLREGVLFPIPALMTLLTLVVMPFLVGTYFSVVWIWLSSAFFHSTQYLVVTSACYLKEQAYNNASKSVQSKSLDGWKYFKFAGYYSALLASGFSLSFLLPYQLFVNGADRALALAAVWVFLNLQHYAVDSLLWKMHNPVLRDLLIP